MKIVCITGTRADYGIYRPLLLELQNENLFDLGLIVTGMHLLTEYGSTKQEIEQDGLKIIATPSILTKGDTTNAMSQTLGLAILYFSDILQLQKPDFILILGDRGEMLAAAIAAHYQNIGIIHLHGGEISGSADDSIRQAISKLSHLHFVASLKSQNNLIRQGEEKWRIFPVGSLRKTAITRINSLSDDSTKRLVARYQLDSPRPKLLIAIHPDSKEALPFTQQIEPLASALRRLEAMDKIIIGPNSDAGGEVFRNKLEELVDTCPHTTYFPSIPADEYLFLLKRVDLLIGNSSSGIIEAPFFNLPSLNIGNRQHRREQGDNVVNVNYDEEEIFAMIKQLVNTPRKKASKNPYDLVAAPEKMIVMELKNLVFQANISEKLLKKEATY